MHLRSIELQIPNRAAAVEFLKEPWGLIDVGTRNDTTYLRGTAPFHYVIAVTEGPARAVLSATFVGNRGEVEATWNRIRNSGLKHGPWVDEFDEPGRGAGFHVAGPEGEPYRFVAERDAAPAPLPADSARPIQVAHVVFNTCDREAASRVLVDAFRFKLSDRTRVMNFLRCDDLHHVVAYADSKQAALNHIAFEMPDLESVMRGMGRLKDAGYPSVWGPGRHGPGNNVFAYFVAPFGTCIEYTAEIQRVDDGYRTGTPDSWQWPPGRNDHWGIASRDNAKLAASGDTFTYRPVGA
ncbi:MAG TPA: VOC family protein [Burkholderiales bacterium]|nr:VOC family protein [Burkholderiales bacterium]